MTFGLAVALILVSSSAAPLPSGPAPSGPTAGATAAVDRSGAGAGAGVASSNASPTGSGSPASSLDLTAAPVAESIPPQTSPTATITFNGLMLDSATDSGGTARTFSFVSDGPGLVSAQVIATSPMDSTRLCIALDVARRVCSTGATPDVTQIATAAHAHWTITLVSAGISTPTVDVAMSWPTDHPSITLDHGRFGGAPNPDSLRTLIATFKPRAGGQLRLAAAWSASTEATLTLMDDSGPGPITVDAVRYSNQSSITPAYTHAAVAGRTYRIILYNDGPNGARMNLTATIEFP